MTPGRRLYATAALVAFLGCREPHSLGPGASAIAPDADATAPCEPGATERCYTGRAGSETVGACRAGVRVCAPDGRWSTRCATEVTPEADDRCGDGLDNDCDGTADEGCGECAPGGRRPCYSAAAETLGVGECRAGFARCASTRRWSEACEGERTPSPEVCGNDLDDDCDGTIDEGCRACDASCPRVADVSSLHTHGCVALEDGAARCFGENNVGQLGRAGATTPWPLEVIGVTGARAIAAGNGVSYVLQRDGTITSWGVFNLASGSRAVVAPRTPPHRVAEVADADLLRSGWGFGCARVRAGALWCWGDSAEGQTGFAPVGVHLPRRVEGIPAVADVATGLWHACVADVDGSVWCWGRNTSGQLGTSPGSPAFRATPMRVPGVSGATRVAAGEDFSCAAIAGGEVRCWGANVYGQAGGVDRVSPRGVTAVPSLSGAVSLAAGDRHACALKANGEMWCWGCNNHGQLGDGTITTRAVPARVQLDGVRSIAAGSSVSCAVTRDGAAWCWGNNLHGRLGNGTDGPTALPARVRW